MTQPAMLGPYPVERELGRGGMGIVYLARDPRLNRQVAIKIVPDALAMNPENLARFEREARLLASVNHPNIASIYGVEEVPASPEHSRGALQRLLVMEYVPGETLSDRIRRGPVPVDEALDYARQIASAVEAAHEAGIVHRDLKPGNVRITPNGLVKVLDFGLAKGGVTSDAEQAQSPTITYSPTGFGVILGTAGYMSPEQARGKPVDKRADLWAFGCVLYETLTARKPFEGETVSDTIARILEREPAWTDLPASTPQRIRDLMRRCLEKDLKKRQRDIGDVRIEIEEAIAQQRADARSSSSVNIPAPPPPQPRSLVRRFGLPALLVLLGAAVGIGAWSAVSGGSTSSGQPLNLAVAFPPELDVASALFTIDGKSLILRGSAKRPDGTADPVGRLYLRSLASWDITPIAGTDGVIDWARSPDGNWLAVVVPASPGSVERQAVKVSVDGKSPAAVIGEWSSGWFDILWPTDNELLALVVGAAKYVRVPMGGGAPREPVTIDYGNNPGGFADLRISLPGGRGAVIRLDAYGPRGYQEDLWALDFTTGKATLLVENGTQPNYLAETGHLLFSRGGSVMAVKMDLATLTTSGEPATLFGGLRTGSWGGGFFAVSREGHLLFAPGGRIGLERRIVKVDANREVSAFVDDRRPYEQSLAISPDGRQVAVVVPNLRGTYEIWTGSAGRPDLRKVIALATADASYMYWSPDAQWLAYARGGRDAKDGVYIVRADGSGEHRSVMLTESRDEFMGPVQWSQDGSGVVVIRVRGSNREFFTVPVSAAGEVGTPRPITLTKAVGMMARISPDGQLIAFQAEDSGRSELYVARFSGQTIVGAPVRVSTGGGEDVHWSKDSKRVYYRQPASQLMSAAIGPNPLRGDTPARVLDLRPLRLDQQAWDLLPDGQILAIEEAVNETNPTSVNIALHWLSTVRSKLPR